MSCEFEKDESDVDSDIWKILKLLATSDVVSNLFQIELMFSRPIIKFLKFSNLCTLTDTKSRRELFTESVKK